MSGDSPDNRGHPPRLDAAVPPGAGSVGPAGGHHPGPASRLGSQAGQVGHLDASPLRVVLVLATSMGGIGTHVRGLAAGLVKRGLAVTVAGPQATEDTFGFTSLGVDFRPVEISTVPRPIADTRAVATLRTVLADLVSSTPDGNQIPRAVVHAHGLRAGLVAGLAVRAVRLPGRARVKILTYRRLQAKTTNSHEQGRTASAGPAKFFTPLLVTWHNAVLGKGPKRLALTGLERTVARMADVTLGASYDLVQRARTLGAKDARLGQVAAPPLGPAARPPDQVRAEVGAGDRPVVLAVGRLAPQKAYDVLLDAAARLRARTPRPLVLVAGEGPQRAELGARIAVEDLPVSLLGHRVDIPDLLAAADIVVLPSRWEARALVAQEALRVGRPLVATAVGGIPDLVGDAAFLVPYNDPGALAGAIETILGDARVAKRLAAAGPIQAATWPDEDDTIDAMVETYRELAHPAARRQR